MAQETVSQTISRAYAKNEHVMLGPITVPTDVSYFAVMFDRSAWPDEPEVLHVSLELSQDDGASWQLCGGFTASGGDHFIAGVLSPMSGIIVPLANPTSQRRQVRGTAVMKADLTTRITLTVSDQRIVDL